jgi:hypothetical protein
MKQLIVFVGLIFIIASCLSQKTVVNGSKGIELEKLAEDSVEYDLKTFDVRFESWYLLQNNPSMYRSQQYYEFWNQQYVNEWNHNATNSQRRRFFEPIIGYDPTVDYGLALNHKLFYYFQYVENVLKIRIMSNSPRSVVY